MKKMAICLIVLMLAACTKSNPIEPFRTDDTSWQPQIHTAITGYNRFYIADTSRPDYNNLDDKWYERNTAYLCAELSKSNSIVRIDTFYNYLNGTQFFPMDFISDAILDAAVPYSVKMVAEYRNGTRRESNAVEIMAEEVPGTVLRVENPKDIFGSEYYNAEAYAYFDGYIYILEGSGKLHRYNIQTRQGELFADGINIPFVHQSNIAVVNENLFWLRENYSEEFSLMSIHLSTLEQNREFDYQPIWPEIVYTNKRITGSDTANIYFYELNEDSIAFNRFHIPTGELYTHYTSNMIMEGINNGTLFPEIYELVTNGQQYWLFMSAYTNLERYNYLYSIDMDSVSLTDRKVVPVFNCNNLMFDGDYFWVFEGASGIVGDEKLVRFSPGAG